MATEVGEFYLRGLKGIGSMLESGNTRERQQALDIIQKRFDSKTAEEISAGRLQAKDRILCDTMPILVQTTPQKIEFFDAGVTGEVKGFRTLDGGKIKRTAILQNLMIEYGTKADTNTANSFTKAIMPPAILTGEIDITHEEGNILNTALHHFAMPDQDNNNLLNGLRFKLNHSKILQAGKEIGAMIHLLNGVPAVAGTTQMLRLSLLVTEFGSNAAQAQ